MNSLENESMSSDKRLQGALDCLREDLTRGHKCQDMVNDKHQKNLRGHSDDIHTKANEINASLRSMIQEQNQEIQCSLIEIRNELEAEAKARERDTLAICEEMTKESTEREKDEAAIVDSIEQLMNQLRL